MSVTLSQNLQKNLRKAVAVRWSPSPAGQLTLPQSREAVLEYVVERKRMDDLAGSITDGRFREQKVLCTQGRN